MLTNRDDDLLMVEALGIAAKTLEDTAKKMRKEGMGLIALGVLKQVGQMNELARVIQEELDAGNPPLGNGD